MYGTIKAIPEYLKFCSFFIKFGYHFGSLGLTTDLRLPTDGGTNGKLSCEGTVIVAETGDNVSSLSTKGTVMVADTVHFIKKFTFCTVVRSIVRVITE